MIFTQLESFIKDHHRHNISFDSQELIECFDCGETFFLPEGTGVVIIDYKTLITLEVPSNNMEGFVPYTISLADGTVEL